MGPTVLSVAYPFAPVGPDPVGGAEQVLAQLDRTLVEAGWTSLVVACEGSTPAGHLVPVPRVEGEIDKAARRHVHAAVADAITRTLTARRVDLVHLHGIDFDAYLPPAGPPVLTTLHLPLDWYGPAALRPTRPRTFLQPVSASQARTAPAGVALTRPIENGVDLRAFPTDVARRPFALALGRICEEKGFHLALDAARRADMPLKLAGEVFPYPAHRRYFDAEIAPRLDDRRRFIGRVAGACKRRLLAAARCVLIPSLVPETSSLVAREAAAAGTPVVTFTRGALVETVEHGRTGFLVEDVTGMAEAIGRVGEIDPAACRATATARFSLTGMTAAYLKLYRELIETAPNAPIRPHPELVEGRGRLLHA